MVMTIKELKEKIAELPDGAEIYGYVGVEGIVIRAEGVGVPMSSTGFTILQVPTATPSGGGPAV